MRIDTLLQPQRPDFDEPAALDPVVRSSRLVGAGEGAHFVSEFSLVGAGMVRYFVEKHNFSALDLESLGFSVVIAPAASPPDGLQPPVVLTVGLRREI